MTVVYTSDLSIFLFWGLLSTMFTIFIGILLLGRHCTLTDCFTLKASIVSKDSCLVENLMFYWILLFWYFFDVKWVLFLNLPISCLYLRLQRAHQSCKVFISLSWNFSATVLLQKQTNGRQLLLLLLLFFSFLLTRLPAHAESQNCDIPNFW